VDDGDGHSAHPASERPCRQEIKRRYHHG
jgi:hypothetical protein